MYNIALHVKWRDWFYILIIGVFFGMFLSALGYILLQKSWLDGAFFGIILGFTITLLSLTFISFINKKILPRLHKNYWLPFSIVFSFLAGFLGTLLSVIFSHLLHVRLIPAFDYDLLEIASIIGVLTYIVGALLYQFVKIRNEKEFVDHQYTQSRLRSLEMQLNPHFLFNALNSIAELIHSDPQKAEMAVLKVSVFLRNTMNESACITLGEELKNAKDYIELENIRFEDKIKLHVPQETPPWSVPKFSIQLIVENAIKHGFSVQKKILNIRVQYDIKSQSILISNDGKVMRNSQFGLGLANLDQRLQLLCKGSLSIKNTLEPTFCIHLGETDAHTHHR